MSRQEIITTIEGRGNAPLSFYQFPPGEGCFIGTLAYKAWHHKRSCCLVCYFDTDSGERFKLMAWHNYGYQPKKSGVNFADDVMNGTRWKCVYDRAKGGTGSVSWQTVEQVPEP